MVKHVGQIVHVNPPCRHVGGHEDLKVLLFEPKHHPIALRLGHLSVQRVGAIAALQQLFGQGLRVATRAAKHHAIQGRIKVQKPSNGLTLVRVANEGELVFDVLVDRRRLVHLHLERSRHVLPDHATDFARHGG